MTNIRDGLSIATRRLVADGVAAASRVCISGRRTTRVARAVTSAPEGIHVDGGNPVVMPGLSDTYVHVNDPGRADWGGFATAGRAATEPLISIGWAPERCPCRIPARRSA